MAAQLSIFFGIKVQTLEIIFGVGK